MIFSSHCNTLINLVLVFSRIVETFSFIRGCRHNWPNHVKTSHAFL